MLTKSFKFFNTFTYKNFNILKSSFYHEKVIEHYEKPRNVGSLNKNDKNVGTGLVGAPACGDVMKLQIKVRDDGVIENAVFKVNFY
jgi:NifU-like protein involved in Fe-S cluster formation